MHQRVASTIHKYLRYFSLIVLFVVAVFLVQMAWSLWRLGIGGWSDITEFVFLVFAAGLALDKWYEAGR